MAIERAISAPLLPLARLGHIGATAQHCSPPAEEAKERLREIVEGFFFRRLRSEDGKRISRLLIKSPPGLGKMREAIGWAIRYQAEQEGKDGTRLSLGDFNEDGVPAQTSIFVPRHQLAAELSEVIECAFQKRGEQVSVPILRGRENGGEEDNRIASALRVNGRSSSARSTSTSSGQWPQWAFLPVAIACNECRLG